MTQISKTFTNGPMISDSCREAILELMDLLQLYTSMEQEVNTKEGLLLINAVISMCDSMLSTYDPQRESSSEPLPIDSPVFYYIYGSSLLSLLFRAISVFPAELNLVLDHEENKLTAYLGKIIPLRRYQELLIESTLEHCREGFRRTNALSLLPILIPTDIERTGSDLGVFDLFDVLCKPSALREIFIEALLAEAFVKRTRFSLELIEKELCEIDPSISNDSIKEVVASKAPYFIQNSLLIIELELEWSSNVQTESISDFQSKCLINVQPSIPNWSIMDDVYSTDDDNISNNILEYEDNSIETFSDSSDEINDICETDTLDENISHQEKAYKDDGCANIILSNNNITQNTVSILEEKITYVKENENNSNKQEHNLNTDISSVAQLDCKSIYCTPMSSILGLDGLYSAVETLGNLVGKK